MKSIIVIKGSTILHSSLPCQTIAEARSHAGPDLAPFYGIRPRYVVELVLFAFLNG
jgi:hypothetical protein